MNIVFTGKLKETRNELEHMITTQNCKMQKAITHDTDLLLVGKRADHFGDTKSSKEIKAEQFGIRIKYIQSIEEVPQLLI